ncbi:MAG TPA: hypothetical protein VNM14_05245 [Planctomycetota bacterium]|nr:hypothetical protein [Planctomycetota bacterium]
MMLLGAFGMLVANAAACLGSWAVLRRLRSDASPLDPLLFLLVRLVIVSATVLGFGAAGILDGRVIGVAGAIALAGLAATGELRALPRMAISGVPRWVWIGVAFLALRLLAQVWFFAPYTTDVLSYHLPKVAEWVRSGSLFGERGVDDHATFPAGFELVEAWWVVFLRQDALIEMAGVEFLLLSVAATAAIGSALGLTPGRARVAALLYALSPGVYFQATSCLNDGAVAATLLATAALAATRAPALLIAAAVGLGAGLKPTFLFALPGILAWWRWAAPQFPTASRGAGRARLALAALGLVLGGFWYGQNALLHGNPVYPVGAKSMPVQSGPGFSSLARNVEDLIAVRIRDDQAPYGPHLDHSAGWGALAFGCGLLSLLLMARQDRNFRVAAAVFGAAAIGVLLFVAHDPWFARFLLFFPALLAVAVVRTLETMPRLLWIAAVAVASQVAGTMLPYDVTPATLRLLARQSWRERSTAASFGADIAARRVGYLAKNRGPAYVLYGPDFSRPVVYLRSTTADGLAREILEGGLDAVFAAPLGPEQTDAVGELARRGLLREERPRIFRVVTNNSVDGAPERR